MGLYLVLGGSVGRYLGGGSVCRGAGGSRKSHK